MKTKFITLIALLLSLFTITTSSTKTLSGKGLEGCIILPPSNIVCEEDLPEGCYIDYETDEVICESILPNGGICNECPQD